MLCVHQAINLHYKEQQVIDNLNNHQAKSLKISTLEIRRYQRGNQKIQKGKLDGTNETDNLKNIIKFDGVHQAFHFTQNG
jgi:hypothetical protein